MSENTEQNKLAKKPDSKPESSAGKGAKTTPEKSVKAKPVSKVTTPGKPKTTTSPAAKSPPKPPASGRGLAWLALLLVLLAIALGYWKDLENQRLSTAAQLQSDNENQRLQAEIVKLQQSIEVLGGKAANEDLLQPRLDQLIASIKAVSAAQSSLADSKQALQSRLASLEQGFSGIDDRQQLIENTLSGLALNQQATDRDVILAEVAFLVRSAAQRLELFNDQNAALDFLQLAEQQLGSIKGQQFAAVRLRLEEDISALRMINAVDIVKLSGELLALENSVDSWQARLPTRSEEDTAETTESSGWWSKVKYLLNSLVTVRQDQANYDFLTLSQADHLKQQIRLELQAARVAALAARDDQYQASLSRVNAWMVEHFDPVVANNAEALAKLSRLQELELNPAWPKLNPLLMLLQQLEGLATRTTPASTSSESEL